MGDEWSILFVRKIQVGKIYPCEVKKGLTNKELDEEVLWIASGRVPLAITTRKLSKRVQLYIPRLFRYIEYTDTQTIHSDGFKCMNVNKSTGNWVSF